MDYGITVDQNGSGNFSTIAAAVDSVPNDAHAIIRIRNGVYHEKLYVRKKSILLLGESREKTVLTWRDGAYFPGPDGQKLGTFRSYTAYLTGERIAMKNMTVRNAAGSGETAGQAVAVYADADFARFENISFESRQDTLFLAPLPPAPKTPGSFAGPGENQPRLMRRDYFENCRISGDVDFIFGGAEAAFSQCTIISLDKGLAVNGYVTAACTPEKQKYGFLFDRCILISDCPDGTVYLGRPWREYAKAAFLNCNMGGHIARAGWALWTPGAGEDKTVHFGEYANYGQGAAGARPDWVWCLSPEMADEIRKEIRSLSAL